MDLLKEKPEWEEDEGTPLMVKAHKLRQEACKLHGKKSGVLVSMYMDFLDILGPT